MKKKTNKEKQTVTSYLYEQPYNPYVVLDQLAFFTTIPRGTKILTVSATIPIFKW